MIEIQSLSKSFGSNQVLKDINLSFRSGEINGVVGENGAGKTTLFKCIAGLEDYNGTVVYSGGVLKNELGFLTTTPFFFSKMTGYEYLQLLCNARNMKGEDIRSKNIFDLPLDQFAENFSTGMKKKLALTGVMLQRNEVFIFDEPFNGVDIQSNILIQDILLKLRSLGKTLILSSHIFTTLEQTCDYLHHLKDGVVQQSLSKEDFSKVEKEMRGDGVRDRIDALFG